MTLKVTQCYRKRRDLFLLVFSVVKRLYLADFIDSATFTVHVTARDLEKSFRFDTTVKITGHIRIPIHILRYQTQCTPCS